MNIKLLKAMEETSFLCSKRLEAKGLNLWYMRQIFKATGLNAFIFLIAALRTQPEKCSRMSILLPFI